MKARIFSHRVINYAQAEEVALHLMCETRLKALWMYPLDARTPTGRWVVFIVPEEPQA
jgi:hypothetical protein